MTVGQLGPPVKSRAYNRRSMPPDQPASIDPVFGRWRVPVVVYLVWLILVTVVDGAGRQACRVPTAKWIAAATDARDRTARTWFRDRAGECLGVTPWYRFSMGALVIAGLAAPVAAVWIVRRRVVRSARSQPMFELKHAALSYSAIFLATLGLTLGTMRVVQWLYDWHS